ncbi:protein SHORT HYPOCOTYL IN WHITE LIGHT 1 [Amaranthus tricolor]|uniref:protein SHORT HYPOCOTYL IN WHITE LIGHT 1 n=1 Tax=Amaranthus tricolor TaxID=29722 RepID=UPI00258B89AA|nr:protein SHORT HYPOCOTYL IN WHITE LIGHT 1 [Amaranthus tricolor]XP_057527468.1 protein SHORT HYPOCOTYL IN WHITE LIGHT 1 [Amaranthus tricolor]
MAATSSLSFSSISFPRFLHNPQHNLLFSHHHPSLHQNLPTLQASRRNSSQENDDLINDSRKWNGFDFYEFEDDDDEDDDEDKEEDRSLDLLIRFVENIFRKVSKRARKAVRSVLPVAISTKLVGFAVNGLIILSFLWVLKAFLEVICTLGSVVFVSILLIRGVWSGVLYLQEGRSRYMNGFDDYDQSAWNRTQPVT